MSDEDADDTATLTSSGSGIRRHGGSLHQVKSASSGEALLSSPPLLDAGFGCYPFDHDHEAFDPVVMGRPRARSASAASHEQEMINHLFYSPSSTEDPIMPMIHHHHHHHHHHQQQQQHEEEEDGDGEEAGEYQDPWYHGGTQEDVDEGEDGPRPHDKPYLPLPPPHTRHGQLYIGGGEGEGGGGGGNPRVRWDEGEDGGEVEHEEERDEEDEEATMAHRHYDQVYGSRYQLFLRKKAGDGRRMVAEVAGVPREAATGDELIGVEQPYYLPQGLTTEIDDADLEQLLYSSDDGGNDDGDDDDDDDGDDGDDDDDDEPTRGNPNTSEYQPTNNTLHKIINIIINIETKYHK